MNDLFDDRRFVIFNVSEIYLIDFNQIYETSPETLRKSLDGTKTFVKFDLPTPSCIELLQTKSVEYTYDQILSILSTPEWSEVNPQL